MSTKKDIAITRGTTNVFADLGYPDAAERQTKTRLALAVNNLLKARKLKQRETAELLHILQPKVSALKNYRMDQFSVERLLAFLTALNQDVEIMIRPRRTPTLSWRRMMTRGRRSLACHALADGQSAAANRHGAGGDDQ